MKFPLLASLGIAALGLFSPGARANAAESPAREIHWLESGDGSTPGTTWGVPWPRGTTAAGATFSLTGANGNAVPMQSWPLAYWPDGSLKWTAHAIPATSKLAGPFKLQEGKAALPSAPLLLTEDANVITVNTGVIECRIQKTGGTLIDSITRAGKTLATGGRLVCRLRSSPDLEADGDIHQDSFYSQISSVTVEQAGPVRAVIKLQGKHAAAAGRAWLPFVVRLYFYAGGDAIRMVHTIIYDGDQNRDFISGLGLRFSVPLD